MDQSYSRD